MSPAYTLLTVAVAAFAPAQADVQQKRLLLVTHSGGFVHNSVGVAEQVLKEVGPKHGYAVTCYRYTGDPASADFKKYQENFRRSTKVSVEPENCGRVNKDTLKNFDAVLFFTTGDPVTPAELADLTAWVKAGGAFAGTHCATDTLYKQNAYGELVGAYFRGHPSGLQTIKLKIEDPKHPAADGFESGMEYKDEIYVFRDAPYSREKLKVLISAEKGSFKPGANLTRTDDDYAVSWCREEGKGKVFYTSLGHDVKVWQDEKFQKHLIGGLDWAVGRRPGDATPSGKK